MSDLELTLDGTVLTPAPGTSPSTLAELVRDLTPVVKAYNARGPRSGVRSNVDATVVLLHRMGLLSAPEAPELILRAGAVADGVECNWGGCRRPAVALRWDDDLGYLNVCAPCAVTP